MAVLSVPVQILLESLKNLEKSLVDILDDDEVSLDDKWAILLRCRHLKEPYVTDICGLSAEEYFDFYFNKYETIEVDRLLQNAIDYGSTDGVMDVGMPEVSVEEFEQKFKEECVKKKIRAFDLDW